MVKAQREAVRQVRSAIVGVSETVKIMSFMSKDGHIDPDLFELFLKSGANLEYANSYQMIHADRQLELF